MAETQQKKHVSLTFMLNLENNKLLFAEAEKDFIDVLFSFLTFPLGTVAKLTEQESKMGRVKVGSLNTLYHSLERLSSDLLWNSTSKDMLLHPRNTAEDHCSKLKLNIDNTQPTHYYVCSNPKVSKGCTECYLLSTDDTSNKCVCGSPLNRPVLLHHSYNGFANNDVATFIIKDDLTVVPFSVAHSCLPIFQNFGLKDANPLSQRTIIMTPEKVLDLLKCCLISKSPLSDFLFDKKPSQESSPTFVPCEFVENSDIQIQLRLIMIKSKRTLVFALAGQDFVDVLISFLTFPLGGVLHKLNLNSSMGSMDALYKGIRDLNEDIYLISRNAKNKLLNPKVAHELKLTNQILPFEESLPPKNFYFYNQKMGYLDSIITEQFAMSEELWRHMGFVKKMSLIPKSATGPCGGFLKGPSIYMVTNGLDFTRMTPVSSVQLFRSLEIPFDGLEEKVVTIGIKEVGKIESPKPYVDLSYVSKYSFYIVVFVQCLNILKASLTSRHALTDGLGHLLGVEEE